MKIGLEDAKHLSIQSSLERGVGILTKLTDESCEPLDQADRVCGALHYISLKEKIRSHSHLSLDLTFRDLRLDYYSFVKPS